MDWVMNRVFDLVEIMPQRFWRLLWFAMKAAVWALPAYMWFHFYRFGIQTFLETNDEEVKTGIFGLYALITGLLLPFELALLLSSYEFGDLRRVVRSVVQEYNRPEPRSVAESGFNHFSRLFFCWGVLFFTPFFIGAALGLGKSIN